MSSVGIFPAPSSAEGYAELGATPQGRLFRKHVLTIGKQFVHPKTGKPITLGEDAWQQMKANFDTKRITPIVQFPLVGKDNAHTEAVEANAGECVGLEREGDRVIAVLDVRDPAVADKIGSTILGASAMLHLDARDPQTAERAGCALLHVAATNRPALVDLAPYEAVVAASGEAYDWLPDGSVLPPTVLMLCASEADDPPVMLSPARPDNNPRPGTGRHHMPYASTYDKQADDIARLGLEAMRLSSGRASRPSYDHAKIEAERQESASLSAEDVITEADCTAAALELSARTSGQASFGDIMAAARELAFSRDERTAREPANVAAALADLAGRLGGTDDPDALALTAASESERIIGLTAHPAKSGRGHMVTTRGKNARAHSDPAEDASTEDPAAAVARYVKMRADLFGGEALDAGSHGTTRYSVRSAAQREREEQRERAGHQGDMRSIPDYARGSARTRHGR